MNHAALKAALTIAAIAAIKQVGLPAFKATSLFASNEKAQATQLAA